MRYFIILICIIFTSEAAHAQNTISINASAEVLVPADKISFRIILNAEAETPQEAYALHKKRENVLVEVLKEYKIQDNDIDFEPITITKKYKNRNSNNRKELVTTRQIVILSLGSFELYEKIQITLIENGFDEFSGNFISSESKKGEDEALKKALKIARQKADIIAQETGLTISGIEDINYSYNQTPPRPMMEMRSSRDTGSLMEFDQSISISASISVSYNFEQ